MLRSLEVSLLTGLAGLVVWLALAPAAVAQAPAGDVALRPGIGWDGVGFYTPQQWGVVRSTVVNRGSGEALGTLSITTRASGQVQFAKEVWVPPGAKLEMVTPLRLDRLPPGQSRGLEAEAALLGPGGQPLASDKGMLNVRDSGFETAVIAGSEGGRLTTMAAALRQALGMSPTTAYLTARAAPAFPPAWGAISLLVLGDPDLDLDAAQMEAMRRFLVGGGRVWVDLTRVDPDFLARLLGEHWDVSVIDRVGLTDFEIEGPTSDAQGAPSRVAVDYPIDHVRVVAPDMETIHTVNGYPASLRKAVGRGTLLVVTLEPDGWLDDHDRAGPSLRSLNWLVRGTFANDSTPDTRGDVLHAVASEQIGYSVIGRPSVAIVLGVFALALLAVGIFLARRGDLARLGWLAPVLAVLAAAALLALGLARQSRVPFTLAAAEILEPAPGTPYARATTFVSVFRPTGASGEDAILRGEGEPTWPDLRTHGGQNVRVVWTGENGWRYENLPIRSNMVQTAQRQTLVPLDQPMRAVAELTGDGLRGGVDLAGLGAMRDAVILTPQGKLTVQLSGDDAFTAPAVDPLGPNQYFEGAVLGQRQMARQEVYRQLAADPRFIERPVLAGWVERTTGQVEVSSEAERRERSLVLVPLELATPEAGEPVAIPASLMRMRPFRGDRSLMAAPIYDERSREWVTSVSNAQTVMMAFDPPAGVAGLDVTAARMTIHLTAPGRPFEILTYDGDNVRVAASGESPAGLLVFELTGENAPPPLADGAIVVGVRVGETPDAAVSQSEPWSLTRMELGVSGTAE